MKRSKRALLILLGPAVLVFTLIFIYPVIRTVMISFHKVSDISISYDKWEFVGFDNLRFLFQGPMLTRAFKNMMGIWFFGSVGIFITSTYFAVMLTSGMKGKSFFRTAMYLPNVVSVVAMGAMWVHYAFNPNYGLFQGLFHSLGFASLANFKWTAPGNIYYAMIIAVTFTSAGHYLLIFMSGIERIPKDYFEVATIEGAGIFAQFRKISFPLLIDVYRTSLVLWSIGCANFFTWSQVFSPALGDVSVVTPMVYSYYLVFASDPALGLSRQIGAGAMIGVLLSLFVVLMFTLISLVMREDKNIEL